ncbi:transposable element Tcb1 transposase [Trichonephila clavipes]|nr:transposable element Tcb1 transposase [Trichonephila clavipes]
MLRVLWTAVWYHNEVLEPIVRFYAAAVGLTFVLMDNNARPHRADIVDDYLESEGITCMAWPACSPDLNPIENLWDALSHTVTSYFPHPATLIELETALQEERRLLNSAVVNHLIESMVRRCFQTNKNADGNLIVLMIHQTLKKKNSTTSKLKPRVIILCVKSSQNSRVGKVHPPPPPLIVQF